MPSVGKQISITTWNIGFGALGAQADLFVDGGKNLRALSKKEIKVAANGIATQAGQFNSDVILIQENAKASFLNRGVNVDRHIKSKLSNYSNSYCPDLKTRLVPLPFKINHGMSSFSSSKIDSCKVLEFPQDPLYYYGFLKKYYGGLIQRIPIADETKHWVIINIHLSAFDEGASVRKKQLTTLFAYAEMEYKAGNYVIIGGDWNMRLAVTDFPYKTPQTAQAWVYDFPHKALPTGWKLSVDASIPTARTLHQAYKKGDNYTSVIYGFVVSPNALVRDIFTHDLDFKHTDHNPVSAQFSTIEADQ